MILFPALDNHAQNADARDASADLDGESYRDGDGDGVDDSRLETSGDRCASNADCSSRYQNEPYRCEPLTGSCQALTSDDCPTVLGSFEATDAFWLGAYAALGHGPAEDSDVIRNYKLAIAEFNAGGGLPDRAGMRHPLAVVVCNNDPGSAPRDPSLYTVTLRHLVSELRVPAVIADLPPAALIEAYQATRNTGRTVLLLSPGAPNDALLALEDDGLVWSLIGSPRDLKGAYQSLIERIETYVKTFIPSRGAGDLRIAVVHSADRSEPNHELLAELADAVLPALQFNGRSWAANAAGANAKTFEIGTATDSLGTALREIGQFAPDVVISMAGPSFGNAPENGPPGVAYLMIHNAVNDRQIPFYVLSPANAGPAFTRLSNVVANKEGVVYPVLPKRVLGINVAGADNNEVYQEYRKRLGKAFGVGNTNEQFENYYDAVYYLAYAAYAVGLPPDLDGLQLETGLLRLTSGPPLNVGPDSVESVVNALRSSTGSILLAGAGGSYFDVARGVRLNSAALFCVDKDGLIRERSQIYTAQTDKWMPSTTDCSPGL